MAISGTYFIKMWLPDPKLVHGPDFRAGLLPAVLPRRACLRAAPAVLLPASPSPMWSSKTTASPATEPSRGR